jgi:hypothetical protein
VPAPKPNLATPPAAKATVQGIAAASGEPVVASAEYIIKWATDRGISGRNAAAMLDQVNARARKLGLRPFAIAGKI